MHAPRADEKGIWFESKDAMWCQAVLTRNGWRVHESSFRGKWYTIYKEERSVMVAPASVPKEAVAEEEVGLGEVVTTEIAKLKLEPGDVLVLKMKHHLKYDHARTIRRHLESYLGFQVKILVLDGGTDLTVVKREDV